MNKVLILSYYFPPCNLTAAQRTYAFAKYLSEDYKCYVVTRNWEYKIEKTEDIDRPSGSVHNSYKKENFEVYETPHFGSLRDKFYAKFPQSSFSLVRKFLSFIELILEKFGIFNRSKWLLYKQCEEIIQKENINTLIISGNPFWQFYFGKLLHKKKPSINWIADFRDDWTTGDLSRNKGFFYNWLYRLDSINEINWLKSAKCITSVTEILSKRIGTHHNKDGFTVANGFNKINRHLNSDSTATNELTISYTGYLYQDQRIEIFIEGFIKTINDINQSMNIKMRFLGTGMDRATTARINHKLKGYEKHFEITPRLNQEECLAEEAKSDVFLAIGYIEQSGIPGSKLYQYISHFKPILLCPNDGDIMYNILQDTGLGITCENSDDVYRELNVLLEKKKNGVPLKAGIKEERIENYSRERQVEKLREIINSF